MNIDFAREKDRVVVDKPAGQRGDSHGAKDETLI